MASQINLSKFNDIYDKTNKDLLKYIIIKCHNINDTKDIIQDTYLELWRILNKKDLVEDNLKSYLIGIANNKIKKYYKKNWTLKTISLFTKDNNDLELINTIEDKININDLVIKQDVWDRVWKYIKDKKNQDIPKVFYLYYELDLTIKEIANLLSKTESYIKHLIYRTLKELQDNFGNGDSYNE